MRQINVRKLVVGMLTCLFAFSFASDAKANLIVNGSFENGTNLPAAVPGYRTLSGATDPLALGGTNDIAGWTVLNNNIDWIHNNYWQASNGTYSLDMSGLSPGGISQTIATNPGETYTLTFDMSVNPDVRHSDTARRLDIVAINTLTNVKDLEDNFLLARGTRTFSDMQWVNQTLTFTASGTSTELIFFSAPSNIDAGGPALDNVVLNGNGVVAAVPAPAGFILAGIGGIGFLAARRKKCMTVAAV